VCGPWHHIEIKTDFDEIGPAVRSAFVGYVVDSGGGKQNIGHTTVKIEQKCSFSVVVWW
jgi:hypothetical protein